MTPYLHAEGANRLLNHVFSDDRKRAGTNAQTFGSLFDLTEANIAQLLMLFSINEEDDGFKVDNQQAIIR